MNGKPIPSAARIRERLESGEIMLFQAYLQIKKSLRDAQSAATMKKLEVESTPDSEWLRQIEGLGQLYKIDLEGTPDSDWNGQTEELEQLNEEITEIFRSQRNKRPAILLDLWNNVFIRMPDRAENLRERFETAQLTREEYVEACSRTKDGLAREYKKILETSTAIRNGLIKNEFRTVSDFVLDQIREYEDEIETERAEISVRNFDYHETLKVFRGFLQKVQAGQTGQDSRKEKADLEEYLTRLEAEYQSWVPKLVKEEILDTDGQTVRTSLDAVFDLISVDFSTRPKAEWFRQRLVRRGGKKYSLRTIEDSLNKNWKVRQKREKTNP